MKKNRDLNESINIRDDIRSKKNQQLKSVNSNNSRLIENTSQKDNNRSIEENKSQVSLKSEVQKIADNNIPQTARRVPQTRKGVYVVAGELNEQNNQANDNNNQQIIKSKSKPRIEINQNPHDQEIQLKNSKVKQNLSQSKVKIDMNGDLQEEKIHQLNNNFQSLSMSVSNIKNQYTQLKQSESKLLSKIKKKDQQNGQLSISLVGNKEKSPKNKQKQLSQSVLYRPKLAQKPVIAPPADYLSESLANTLKKPKIPGKLDDPKIFQFILQRQKQQQQRQKRRLQQIQKIQNERYLKQQKQFQEKQQQKNQRMSQIRSSSFIKQKMLQKKAQQATKLQQSQKIAKKYLSSLPLFQIKQKQNLQNQIKRAQQIRQYLKKHRQQSLKKQFLQKSIQQHQKWHTQQIEKLDKQKNEQRNKIMTKIQEDNQKLKNLYRGKATQIVLNQLKDIQLKKQVPHIYKERIKDYQGFVRENLKPKLMLRANVRSNSHGSLDMRVKRQSSSNLSFREIKRFKYIHGVSYGQIVQQRPVAKSYQQNRRLGQSYLQYMKTLPKKQKSIQNQLQSYSRSISLPKPPVPNPLKHNRVKKASIKLNSQPTRDQINMVLDQLRQNDKKIRLKQKMAKQIQPGHEESSMTRKQINDQLLLNLQKKMNLLHKLETNSVETN